MTEPLPIERLRSGWIQRVRAVCEYPVTATAITDWLETLSPSALVAEARVVEAALADDRSAGAALDVLHRHLLRRGPHPRLTTAVRVALISKIVRAELTEAPFVSLLDRLLEADEAEHAQVVAKLLVPSTKPSLAGVHAVLAHGLRAVPVELWPRPPYHGGAKRPDIGATRYPTLATSLAAHLERAGAPDQLVDRLRHAASKEGEVSSGNLGTSVRPAVKFVASALSAAGSADACTAFLAAVDDELLRLDTVNALARYKKKASAPIHRTLWRGMMGKRVVAWIAELRDDVYGLLCRLPLHYQWIEGSRDDVLATVPVDHFEQAVMAVLEH